MHLRTIGNVTKKKVSTRARRPGRSAPASAAGTKPLRQGKPSARKKVVAKRGALTITEVDKLDDLRRELERAGASASPLRWNADPDDVQRSVAQLVLTIVEFLRRLMERQAIRRMEQRTLTRKEVEAVGVALMRLEETIRDIGKRFGLEPEDLNLDLGPAGRLM